MLHPLQLSAKNFRRGSNSNKALKPYTAGKISTENLLDNVLTYISEHFCFYTLCIISAYKYVKKLRKCK